MSERAILLVEDDPDDVDLTRRAFARHDVRNPLVVARDGVEALDHLFRMGSHAEVEPSLPALVLLDVKLPRIDGLEVLRRIKADDTMRCVPVVMLTSSREPRDISSSYRLGANSYVHKPVDSDEFDNVARSLSHYWLVINQPPVGA